MSYGIVLNHHSLPFTCKQDADNGLLPFFNVLKECRTAGLNIILVDEDQDKSLMGLELAEGYFVRDWYTSAKNSPELRDWQRILISLETRQPLFGTVVLDGLDSHCEVGLIGENIGKAVLLAAFSCKTFLASFTALASWTRANIDVWVLDINALQERSATLLNLCDDASLITHGEELKQRRNTLLTNAKDIWLRRSELFPNLSLLANQIGTALQSWSARQDVLSKARDALYVLELFSAKWSAGEFTEYRHEYLRCSGLSAEVSGESLSVYRNPKKKKERLFWLEDGREVYFENHVKLPDGYRMHFYPDPTKKRIYVAYLGPHLTL